MEIEHEEPIVYRKYDYAWALAVRAEHNDIEAVRAAFENDASANGFDLTRLSCESVEPWIEYDSEETGLRWAGWLAGWLSAKSVA